jgi:phosphoenolpyruvate synthase/pyruvate phosphate dikinase
MMARDLSARLGYETDLEGAIADGRIYLFQARPITTLHPRQRSASPPVTSSA